MSQITDLRRRSQAIGDPAPRSAGMQEAHAHGVLQSLVQVREEGTYKPRTRLSAESLATSKFECSFKQFQDGLR